MPDKKQSREGEERECKGRKQVKEIRNGEKQRKGECKRIKGMERESMIDS